MKSPLTEPQKERLRVLEQEIETEKLTSSFTIEDRDSQGRRKSTFFSASIAKKGASGWTAAEEQIVAVLLGKRVTKAAYRDAVKRGIITMDVARQELPAILVSYDADLSSILEGSSGVESER